MSKKKSSPVPRASQPKRPNSGHDPARAGPMWNAIRGQTAASPAAAGAAPSPPTGTAKPSQVGITTTIIPRPGKLTF